MNSNVVMGILRAIVPGLVGYLVGKGYIPADQGGEVAAAIITLGAAGWSVVTNLENKPAAPAAPATPEVKK